MSSQTASIIFLRPDMGRALARDMGALACDLINRATLDRPSIETVAARLTHWSEAAAAWPQISGALAEAALRLLACGRLGHAELGEMGGWLLRQARMLRAGEGA